MSNIETVLDIFDEHIEKRPNHTALICEDNTRSWKEFDERANQVANALLELGIEREQKVGVSTLFDRSIEFMETFYGAMKLAAIPFYLNHRFTGKEAKYVIENADTSFLFLEDKLLPTLKEVKGELENIEEFVVIGEEENVPDGMIHFEELVSKQPKTPPSFDWEKPMSEDIPWLQYTTGTTGKPKGATMRHESFLNVTAPKSAAIGYELLTSKYDELPETLNVKKKDIHPRRIVEILTYEGRNVDKLIDIFGDEVFLDIPPLITAAGADHAMCWLSYGATVVFPPGIKLDPGKILQTIEERKVTSMLIAGDSIAVPLVKALKNNEFDTDSVAWTYSTGVEWSKDVKKDWLELIPTGVILDVLSTTEAWYNSANLTIPGEEPESGKFLPFSPRNLVILNDDGEPVEPGEMGEIVTTKKASEGYYEDPEKTAETFKEMQMSFQEKKSVWVFTGDYGTYDGEGKIEMMGRGAEVIDSGGLKVFTPEVREFIAGHPKVKDAAVVGTPHERWGDAVTAIVELEEGASLTKEEIVDYCSKELADYKLPKRVVFTEVPRGPQGKIPIKEAIKIAKRELGLED